MCIGETSYLRRFTVWWCDPSNLKMSGAQRLTETDGDDANDNDQINDIHFGH